MTKSTLIRRVHMSCPLCDMSHEVEERTRTTTTNMKGIDIAYTEKYFVCSNSKDDENEFVTGSMMDENLLNARNAYRIKRGLLTSDDIVSIRERYGLSQVDLAKLLGWGEATISRYESKAIQDDSYDMMLRLIKDNPLYLLELYRRNSFDLAEGKRDRVRDRIVEMIETYGKEYLSRQVFESEYVYFVEPSESNGFVVLNVDKTEAAISYIAARVSNLYKVKLMKMLWYSDALSYKNTGHAITGLVYRHNDMGALPVGHYSLMNLHRLNIQEEESYNFDSIFHIYPTAGMDYSVLSDDDISVLDTVIDKFKGFKTREIVEYMHEERAYLDTRQGDIIPFSPAEVIRDF